MPKDWLIEYWWILVLLLFVVVLALAILVLNRRGTLKTTWPKISLVVNCVIIGFIPAMSSPGSYYIAAIVVFNLLTLLSSFPKSEKPLKSVDQ
jgi:hypothetical protein